jgi:hypothetical protein
MHQSNDAVTVAAEADTDGFSEVHLFSFAYKGRGAYGDNYKIRLGNYVRGDKTNEFKNYLLEVLEGTDIPESFPIVFNANAISDDSNLYADGVIADYETGSKLITFRSNLDGFASLYSAYTTAVGTTTITAEAFDPLLGIDKKTGLAIAGLELVAPTTGTVSLNALAGIAAQSGSDGDFAATADKATRDAALETIFTNAFKGLIDDRILSKNSFPANLILDANYPASVKQQMCILADARKDCSVIIDCGTEIASKSGLVDDLAAYEAFSTSRLHQVEGYYGKVKDPYSKKIYKVTATYALAALLPLHFQANNGKHVPFAGAFGAMTGFLPNTIYPIFDPEIDWAIMNKLVAARCNYVQIDPNQNIIRGTQTTRQEIVSNLSEANNMYIANDIKRDTEALMARCAYNFNESADLGRFNTDISVMVLPKYENQVKTITGLFKNTPAETENNILHLYIELRNKSLVKNGIIEIDITR